VAQLRSFRLGWQSQNIAQFLLYKLAFLSEPIRSADDVGTDYYCTLFETQRRDGNAFLLPRNSFAIQIKSESDGPRIDITGYLPYLSEIEVPYFVGLVSRNDLTLSIYSGELLPALFAYRGVPNNLHAELCESSRLTSDYVGWHTDLGSSNYSLLFPEVFKLSANMSDLEVESKAAELRNRCSLMLKNIASIRNKEFILRGMGPGQVLLFAGTESFNNFEANFLERLIEAFYNLSWAYDALPLDRAATEEKFRMYEEIYLQVASHVHDHAKISGLKDIYLSAKGKFVQSERIS
jgi:hypothetical protein